MIFTVGGIWHREEVYFWTFWDASGFVKLVLTAVGQCIVF
jgi:hypothetical protein